MVRRNSSRRVGLLESVVLICGHCQGLLLHLRITFETPLWWILISIALGAVTQAKALHSTTVSLATDSASHLVPWRGKLTCARASSPVPSMASTLPSPNLL
ncbi:hypothetical protein C8D04_1768 [Simplicispira sp. 125]|nr:hypothetical protein C8D04_1768 [Simplicispira sp. 125]REG17456.1 hypothetical protein C8D01_2078 [Simplicispira sp. 110]